MLNWEQYRRFPSVPESIPLRSTHERLGAWVEISDPVYHCDRKMERTFSLPVPGAAGAEETVFYLPVTDRAETLLVLAVYNRVIDCDAVRRTPLRGVPLAFEGSPALQDLRAQGLWVPASATKQQILQFGTSLGPGNSLFGATLFATLSLLGAAWVGVELRRGGRR